MAVENFADLLNKLKEVHDQEVEGWHEKVLELTNKKNCDAKRLEELYNRNQQLREQQKMLTENIKQLENMLRAGLCDRCTVTQEMAKKRQQDYENSQLQSLQHISLLTNEIGGLMKENDRLKEEVKSLHGRIEGQNGHSEEAGSAEIKASADPAAAALTLVTSVLKQVQKHPAGGATSLTSTAKPEREASPTADQPIERQTPEKRIMHKIQTWSGTHHLDSRKPLTLSASAANPLSWKERRATSIDSAELHPSLPSPLSSHLRHLKNNPFFPSTTSEERHTPVPGPLRPHPIKTAPPTLTWPLQPEHPDWIPTMTASSRTHSRGILGETSSMAILRFPGLVLGESHQPSEGSGRLKLWPDQPVFSNRRSLSELGDGKERKPTVSVISPPCWKKAPTQPERIFGENLREGEVEAPLDLSNGGEGGGNKDKELEPVRNQIQSQSDTALSSSSSSPEAPLSSQSSHCASSPQSDVQAGDVKPQKEETWERCTEEGREGKEKNENAEVSENPKIPTLTISLRPVVVLESLQTVAEKEQELGQSRWQEQEESDEDHQGTTRKRSGEDTEGLSLPQRLKEKRIKVSAAQIKITQGSSHGDSEQD